MSGGWTRSPESLGAWRARHCAGVPAGICPLRTCFPPTGPSSPRCSCLWLSARRERVTGAALSRTCAGVSLEVRVQVRAQVRVRETNLRRDSCEVYCATDPMGQRGPKRRALISSHSVWPCSRPSHRPCASSSMFPCSCRAAIRKRRGRSGRSGCIGLRDSRIPDAKVRVRVQDALRPAAMSSGAAGSAGMACFSLSQAPRSTSRQRSLQNGRDTD